MILSKQPEYQIWAQMKQRCHNPKSKKYMNYGARGIFVCERWKNSYLNFIEDMGQRPTDKHSIERVDVNGPYSPENCKWLLIKEQNKNRTDSSNLEVGEVIGKLTILYEVEGKFRPSNEESLRRMFMTRCECGNEREKRMDKLNQAKKKGIDITCGERTCNKYAPIVSE
jgi:hypothetical protein